jgi:hypothetical protein
MSRWNLLVNGLSQPESSLFPILRYSASKCVHDPEHIHGFSIAGLCQGPQTIRSFHVPTHGFRCMRPAELRIKTTKTILGKRISLFG